MNVELKKNPANCYSKGWLYLTSLYGIGQGQTAFHNLYNLQKPSLEIFFLFPILQILKFYITYIS